MATLRIKVNSVQAVIDCAAQLRDFWLEHKYVNVTLSDKRSLDANAAIRMCYKQIRQHREDMTAKDVERHCKLYYGVPIRRQNCEVEEFVYARVFKGMTNEQKLKTMDCFSVTSVMTTSESNQMIECMMQDFPFIVIEKKQS